jgi:hypothetical protein
MVDGALKSVNKAGWEALWYRPRLAISYAGAHVLPTIDADGAPGRFSTIVENSVENSGLSGLATMKTVVVSGSAYGEGRLDAIFASFAHL